MDCWSSSSSLRDDVPLMQTKRLVKWGAGLLLLAGVLSSAGIYAYINFLKEDAPPPLSFEQRDAQVSTIAKSEVVGATGVATCDAPIAKTFDAGSVDVTVADSDQVMVGNTSMMSGEVQVCGELIVGGTIDIDASTLMDGTEKAEALQAFLQADEFPIVTLTIASVGKGTALIADKEVPVELVATFRDGKPVVSVAI
jgi:hypothetical protein